MARNNRELNYDSKVLIKLSKEDHEFFKEWSEKVGSSMSSLVRQMIEERKQDYPSYVHKPYAGERMTWGSEFD